MKTRIELEIESPDSIEVTLEDEPLDKEEWVRFAKDWHNKLVAAFKEMEDKEQFLGSLADFLEEWYSETGDLPEFKINFVKVRVKDD